MDDTYFAVMNFNTYKSWKILAQKLDIGADGPTCEDKWADCILACIKWKNPATRSEIENQEESSKWMQTLVEWLSTKDICNPSSSSEIDGESQPNGIRQSYPDSVFVNDEETKDIIKNIKASDLTQLRLPIIDGGHSYQYTCSSNDDDELFD